MDQIGLGFDTSSHSMKCWHCGNHAMECLDTIGTGEPTEGHPVTVQGPGLIDLCECRSCGAREARGDAYLRGDYWPQAQRWIDQQRIGGKGPIVSSVSSVRGA